VPFAGGESTIFGLSSRGFVRSADETVRFLAARAGSTGEPELTQLPHREGGPQLPVHRRTWPNVTQYIVEGGGHVIPQLRFRPPRALGQATHDLDMPVVALDAFLPANQGVKP
jgi:polyhydroxybutyrate depolymerase